MKVPLNWLREYVDLSDQSVEDVAALLTFSGVEVEGIETSGAVLNELFVVGEIIACDAHPSSDHLHVCKVSDGKEEFQVVCGAPNARQGLKAPFAKVGAVVPNGGFAIKKAKLRGVESFGMLCSTSELCVPGGDHDGIWEIDAAVETGTPVSALVPEAEVIFDLEITWNRPDCLSIIGIARELAALLRRPLLLPAVDFEENGNHVDTLAAVKVEAPELCPRYTARVATGLNREAASPEWMVRRLEQCGMRSLGLAVDVTNYVMLECGQPLHAFDHTRLADSTIIVRRAKENEKIVTLDGVERKLDPSMLVIADAAKPSAIAGIMGGAESEIESDTGIVLLESALFTAPSTKYTATRLGLASESSRRFERGVDPDLADWASRRAISLLASLGGCTVCKGMIDVDNRDTTPCRIALSYRRVSDITGIAVSPDTVKDILTSLGLTIFEDSDTGAIFEIPSWRIDLTREADLIEEVVRMNGLDKIPDRLPTLAAVSTLDDSPFRAKTACRHTLLSLGFTEAMHYSFLSAQELEAFDPRPENRLALPNPVSAEYAVMRDSLLPQLAASLGRNASRQVEQCALFEIGRVFAVNEKGRPCEEERISLGMMGPFGRSPVNRRAPVSNEEALLWLKGAIEAFAERLHAGRLTFSLTEHPAMESGFAVEIMIGRNRIGVMGAVSAEKRHQWRLTSPMVLAELSLSALTTGLDRVPRVKPVPQYPAIRRDIAFIAPAALSHERIVQTIRKKAPAELTAITLFDIFTSKTIGSGKRSLGYTLEFRSAERTLTDDEINAAFTAIIQALKEELGVDVREK